jgi:hypothetical protein
VTKKAEAALEATCKFRMRSSPTAPLAERPEIRKVITDCELFEEKVRKRCG